MAVEQREHLRSMRNCIYCFAEGKQSKEHVFPRPLGYKLPVRMVCRKCNNDLGRLDKALKSDYWIRLHQGKGVWDPTKSPFLRVRDRADGTKELLEPHTDPASWRPVGKAAFELMAFFVQEEIYKTVFDEWRDFIRHGRPDLSDPQRRPRAMFRSAIAPNRWGNVHIVTLDRLKSCSVLWLAIYGSYEFFCTFALPSAKDEPRLVLTVDLDTDRDLIWRQPDTLAKPELSHVIRAKRPPGGIIVP